METAITPIPCFDMVLTDATTEIMTRLQQRALYADIWVYTDDLRTEIRALVRWAMQEAQTLEPWDNGQKG